MPNSIANYSKPTILWAEYMDFLLAYGKRMKTIYTKKARANKPITWGELDVMKEEIQNGLFLLDGENGEN